MEKTVEQLEAMFQKAESDINNLSQKLKYEFENNEELEANPVRMMDKISDVKKEYSALVQEAAAVQEAQKEAVNQFRSHLGNVCLLLQKIQNEGIMTSGEKPEELKQLEELVGLSVPWGDSSESPPTETPLPCPTVPKVTDSGVRVEDNQTESSECSLGEPDLSPVTKRQSSDKFQEITQTEFESVSSLIRGRVKLSDVNNTYRLLWEDHKSNKNSKPYSVEDMAKIGLRVSGHTGQAKLKVLRALKLLKITSKGDVEMLV